MYFSELLATQRSLKRLSQIRDLVDKLLLDRANLQAIGVPPVIIHRCARTFPNRFGAKYDYVINDGHHRLAALYFVAPLMPLVSDLDYVVCDMTVCRKPLGRFYSLADRFHLDVMWDKPRLDLPERCNYAKKYKGITIPKCMGGRGCQACWATYCQKHSDKFKRKGPEEAHPQGLSDTRLIDEVSVLPAASIDSW